MKLKRILIAISIAVTMVSQLGGISVPKVKAAGDQYAWANYISINVTGTLTGTLTLQQAQIPGFPETASATLKHSSGCNINANFTLNKNGNGGIININPTSASSGSTTFCSDSIASTFNNETVQITGTRPADSADQQETSAQKNVNYRYTFGGTLASAPATVSAIVTKSGSTTQVDTFTIPKTAVDSGQGTQIAQYISPLESHKLEPGTYTVCVLNNDCTDFTKVKYNSLNVEWGSVGIVNVTVPVVYSIRGTVGASKAEIPAITFTITSLDDPSVPPQTVTTDPISLAGGFSNDGSVPLDQTFNSNVQAVFNGVLPGKYKVCIPSANICKEFTKAKSSITVTFDTVDANTATGFLDQNGAGVGGGGSANSCESLGGVLSWIECPVIVSISKGLQAVDDLIQNQLASDVISDQANSCNAGSTSCTSGNATSTAQLKTTWIRMRDLAYIILVPIMLVMVIGTAIGMGPFDAYTVKKALPRMIVGVIFIAFSWYICIFVINLTNTVGGGIKGIIEQPFISSTGRCKDSITLACVFDGGVESVVTNVILILPAIAALILILVFYLAPLLLFLAITYGVIVLRQIFIVALVLVSPLAILPWIFPMNNKLWKAWWDSFSKLLMVYPLIMILISVGHVFAYIIDVGDKGGIASFLFKISAYILPLAFIPAAFKFVGGAFATLSGMANDRSKGLFDRMKKGRADKFHRAQHGKFIKNATPGSWADKHINSRASVLANANKLGLRNWSGKAHNIHRTHAIQQRDALLKDENFIGAGDDEITRAMATSSSRAEFLDNIRTIKSQSNPGYRGSHDEKADLAQYDELSKVYGTQALRSAALFRAVAGGTTMDRDDKGGISWLATAADIAGGDRSILADLVGKGRSIATQAGKPLAGGMSHGTGMAIALSTQEKRRYTYNEGTGEFELDQQWALDNNGRDYNTQDAVLDSRRASWDQQSGGSFIRPGVKLDDVRATVGIAKDDIVGKVAAAKFNEEHGTEASLAKANSDVLRAFAQQDQMYQSLNYATPEQLEVAQPFFNESVNVGELPQAVKDMLSKTDRYQGIPVQGTVTRSQLLNDLHSTAEFQTTSKQFYGEAGLRGLSPAAQNAAADAASHGPEGAAPPPPPNQFG